MNTNIKKLVICAMLTSLCCVATMIIKIPSPFKGYINLGDCIVLLSGFLLTPQYAFLAAGLGSALADFFLGYTIYIPATFIIKGSMALIINYFINKKDSFKIIGGVIAEIFMVLSYLLFETLLYGFIPSLPNVFPNIVQGSVGLILALYLINIFKKNNISFKE